MLNMFFHYYRCHSSVSSAILPRSQQGLAQPVISLDYIV